MIFGVITLLFSTNLYVKNSRLDSIIWLIITVIAGLRFGVGADYFTYASIYDTHNDISRYIQTGIFNPNHFLEPGFALILSLFKTIGIGYNGFNLIISFISLYTIRYEIKRLSSNIYVSNFVYFTFYWFLLNLSGIRQGLAIIFILKGIHSIISGNKYKLLFYSVLAISIHLSSILLFPIYFLRYKIKHHILFAILSSLVILMALNISIFDLITNFFQTLNLDFIAFKISNYVNREEIWPINLKGLVYLTIHLLIFIYFRKLESTWVILIRNLSFSFILFRILLYQSIEIASRLLLYSNIALIFALPLIYNSMKDKKSRFLLILLIIILGFLEVFEYIINNNGYYKYDIFM